MYFTFSLSSKAVAVLFVASGFLTPNKMPHTLINAPNPPSTNSYHTSLPLSTTPAVPYQSSVSYSANPVS